MSESVEIAQRLDAIYDTELTNRLVSSLSSPSYTLAELNAAAEQFVDSNDASSDLNAPDAIKLRIFLGMFLQQLAKKERERGANERRTEI